MEDVSQCMAALRNCCLANHGRYQRAYLNRYKLRVVDGNSLTYNTAASGSTATVVVRGTRFVNWKRGPYPAWITEPWMDMT